MIILQVPKLSQSIERYLELELVLLFQDMHLLQGLRLLMVQLLEP